MTKWNARSPQAHDILLRCDAAIRRAYPGSWLFAPAMTAGKVRPEIEDIVPPEMMDDFISYLNNTRPQGITFRKGAYKISHWIETVEKLGNTRHRPPKWYLDFLRASDKREASSTPDSPLRDEGDGTEAPPPVATTPKQLLSVDFLIGRLSAPEKPPLELLQRPWA
ncbi:hypothetical protein PAPYR_10403 [Paratrimastix pyriformis]|uniref:Uncharacterized protein n=1 Tax=Paratrimastix pyriformis TaxID=342808 RepID=A0ABQ8U620_9EUKA|nr:hypothetical protein PAPYR_13476 [Paratrimastix pyriformis]KAJ4454796.1 hypothetical protein PAPYR_10403 [Paratrimastix pyriformis]